jgi:threonine/homoserine/homoserine lactone efflux protein
LLVIMTPGPDLALITQLVLTYGRLRPAVTAAAGMITAGVGQVRLGMAGLATLLAVSPALFTALRWAGAGVLLFWAVRSLSAALRPPAAGPPPAVTDSRVFLRGLLCTGSNPKVGIFLMAFLPQFVPADADPVAGVATLAVVYLSMGLLWLLAWMNLVRRLSHLLHAPMTARVADAVIAGVFGFFALRLILE